MTIKIRLLAALAVVLLSVACGDSLTSPTPPKAPYVSLYPNPTGGARDPSECRYFYGALLCPNP